LGIVPRRCLNHIRKNGKDKKEEKRENQWSKKDIGGGRAPPDADAKINKKKSDRISFRQGGGAPAPPFQGVPTKGKEGLLGRGEKETKGGRRGAKKKKR